MSEPTFKYPWPWSSVAESLETRLGAQAGDRVVALEARLYERLERLERLLETVATAVDTAAEKAVRDVTAYIGDKDAAMRSVVEQQHAASLAAQGRVEAGLAQLTASSAAIRQEQAEAFSQVRALQERAAEREAELRSLVTSQHEQQTETLNRLSTVADGAIVDIAGVSAGLVALGKDIVSGRAAAQKRIEAVVAQLAATSAAAHQQDVEALDRLRDMHRETAEKHGELHTYLTAQHDRHAKDLHKIIEISEGVTTTAAGISAGIATLAQDIAHGQATQEQLAAALEQLAAASATAHQEDVAASVRLQDLHRDAAEKHSALRDYLTVEHNRQAGDLRKVIEISNGAANTGADALAGVSQLIQAIANGQATQEQVVAALAQLSASSATAHEQWVQALGRVEDGQAESANRQLEFHALLKAQADGQVVAVGDTIAGFDRLATALAGVAADVGTLGEGVTRGLAAQERIEPIVSVARDAAEAVAGIASGVDALSEAVARGLSMNEAAMSQQRDVSSTLSGLVERYGVGFGEVVAGLAEGRALLEKHEGALGDLASRLTADTRSGLDELGTRFAEGAQALTARLSEVEAMPGQITKLNGELVTLHAEAQERMETIRRELGALPLVAQHEAQLSALNNLSSAVHSIANQTGETRQVLGQSVLDQQNLSLNSSNADALTQNAIAENRLLVEKYGFELSNMVTHLTTSTHSRLNTIELRALNQSHEVMALSLAKSPTTSHREKTGRDAYVPAQAVDFEETLARAASDFPKIFPLWFERLDEIRIAFDDTKIGNAANEQDLYSRAFRDFVRTNAAGRVLDVGPGVFGTPYYLEFYPPKLLSGIEPLPMKESCDFELVRGIGEYLPWPDGAFNTVISGTSLDHCISLETSLDEMTRVLAEGGTALLWIGSTEGSAPFTPDAPDFTPADRFHLFHFDAAWFEPMLTKRFEIIERIEMDRISFSHVFYKLKRRPRNAA